MQLMFKKAFDFFASLLLLMLLLPIILIIALLIWIKLDRPIFFKQMRPGLYGRPFLMYKFRTMQEAYSGGGILLPDAERLTKLGKFLRKYSLDELPELFNVLKGDMSLIGPRPLLVEYLPLYSKEQARRHEVKPGITGWAQINGRNLISWKQRFNLDVWYVDNQSFWLDLKILCITFKKVLKKEGINQIGFATMEKFNGFD
jgi:sugar transferase EpsL